MKLSKLLGCRDRLQDILVFQIDSHSHISAHVVSHSPEQSKHSPYKAIRMHTEGNNDWNALYFAKGQYMWSVSRNHAY